MPVYVGNKPNRELVVLRREDGPEVAVFAATGATPEAVEHAAWQDYRERRSR